MPKRSNERLTKRLVEKVPPGKIVFDADMPGFGVRATSAGTKSFIAQYRTSNGQTRRMVLGGFPTLTVDEARDLAREALADVKKGNDPSAKRAAVRSEDTFADRAAHYCDVHGAGLKPRTVNDARHLLDRFAVPAWGGRRMSEISSEDVQALIDKVKEKAGVSQANRLNAVLSKVFALAIGKLCTSNPCSQVKKIPEDPRTRHYSEEELAKILAACDSYPYQNPANAVRLLIFTGARLREVLAAPWSQFDLEQGIWRKPSSHTKAKKLHLLGLPTVAVDLLRQMRETDPDGKYLFPGKDAKPDPADPKKDLRQPRADLKNVWKWIAKETGIEDGNRHDFRRTMAAFMIDDGQSLPVIARTLGHTQLATTLRYSQMHDGVQKAASNLATQRMVRLANRQKDEVLELESAKS